MLSNHQSSTVNAALAVAQRYTMVAQGPPVNFGAGAGIEEVDGSFLSSKFVSL